MQVLSVAETRPQYIKAAMLSRELRKVVDEDFVIAGPHHDPSRSFADFIEMPRPEYNLGSITGSSCQTIAKYMTAIEEILDETDPDIVLTFGDSNGTLATALASVKSGYPVAHIDAGLRTYNRRAQEELNRVATDHIADIFFCPTATCVDNLAKESIVRNVFLTGDLMVDALLLTIKISLQKSTAIQNLNLQEKEYIVLAIHNTMTVSDPENVSQMMGAIISSGEKIVFALDSKIEKSLDEAGLLDAIRKSPNVTLTAPMNYTDFIRLTMGAKKIVTDSSVIQREAYILKVPCITLRNETEWPETVEDGWNILVGMDRNKIARAMKEFEPTVMQKAIFGEGKAAIKIARVLQEGLKEILESIDHS